MEFYKNLPIASDRMGEIWALSTIKDAYIIEFGPAGTTHFAMEVLGKLSADQRASIFTTHIDESDISLGDESRIRNTIFEIDSIYKPKYIFLMASSISAIIGTDIESICYELNEKTNAKLIPLPSGGFKGDFTKGVENILSTLAREVVKDNTNKKIKENKIIKKYNIIGSNIDSYKFLSDTNEIMEILNSLFDVEVNSIFTAYTSIDEIESASEADFNIVIRAEGIKCAEILKERFNIPFIFSRPYGMEKSIEFIKTIEKRFELKINDNLFEKKIKDIKKCLMNFRFYSKGLDNMDVKIVGDFNNSIGFYYFLSEIGFNIKEIIIKHKLTKEMKNLITEDIKDIIKINIKEEDIEKAINEDEFYLLLADGSTLLMQNNAKVNIQISNPNVFKENTYKKAPFIGLNGIEYFLDKLKENTNISSLNLLLDKANR